MASSELAPSETRELVALKKAFFVSSHRVQRTFYEYLVGRARWSHRHHALWSIACFAFGATFSAVMILSPHFGAH